MAPKPTYEDLQRRVTELEKQIAGLRTTETALRITELWQERIFNSLEEAVLVVTPDRKLTNVNDGAVRMFGYSREELASLSTAVLHVDQDHYVEFGKIIQEAFDRDEPANFEFEVKRKNGEIFPSEHTVTLLKGDQGKHIGIVSVVRDVTERKQYERELEKRVEERTAQLKLTNEALRENEGRFSGMFEHMSSGVAVYESVDNGEDFVFKAFNPAAEGITHISRNEALGNRLLDLFPHMDKSGLLGTLQRVWKTGREEHIPPFYYKDEKREGWRENRIYRLPTGEVVALFDDVTERKQSQEALRESEEKFKVLFESAPDAYYLSDLAGNFLDGNKASGELLGYKREELIGKNFLDLNLLVSEQLPKAAELLAENVKGLSTGPDEFVLIRKDDEQVTVEIMTLPVKIKGEDIVLGIARDITERRSLETQLQQAQKMETIGTLAGGIAHDFNNILGGIMGYAELAKMKLPKESKVIGDLKQVIKSSERAADLIKQILTVSRQHKKEQRPVQVRYIVNEALKLLKATLPTTIEIREDLLKESGIVNADPTQMHQVIMNLCTNAGHAMQKDGGVLTVKLANVELGDIEGARHLDLNAGSYLRLTVSDTGHGMSSAIMERIFDPYYTTKDTGEGTGLGLSVAQGIVKVHGGTITVYSQPGKGTTFHVYLPIIQDEERKEKKSEGPLPTGSERILFIDDEQILIDLGYQMLGRLGYDVVTKKSSIEALELFRAEPDRFDLVITDMTMPHMTGDKLAKELIKIRPDIPIILCTGHSRLVSEAKAKEMGVRAFVMKPILRRTIAETVRKALD